MIGQPANAETLRVHPPTRAGLAHLLTEVFAPLPVVATLLVAVAWRTASSPTQALIWGLVAALFASAVPFVYIVRGVRRRRFTDHHVSVRRQRPLPLFVAICSIAIGLTLMVIFGAPRPMIALIAAMTVGLIVSLAITLFWKISVHAAVLAGAVVIVALVFGLGFFWLAPLVALLGWARLERGDHTVPQVLAGAVIGALIAGGVFIPLR
jgi:hypothetical protein